MRTKSMKERADQHLGIKAQGRKEFVRHLKGEKLSPKEGIVGKCYDCCAGYVDGRYSCEMPECPLFPWMPYKGRKLGDDQGAEFSGQ